MKVLVDTDVWSEALRKKGAKSEFFAELSLLIEESRVQMIGPIRMEILCGIRDEQTFALVQKRLAVFRDGTLDADIFIMAARFFNLCRHAGIQGSNTDFVICACAVSWEIPILSKDHDFRSYQKLLPIEIAKPRGT